MPDKKKPIRKGHQPIKRGYQPEQQPISPSPVEGGYQPPTSEGDNPANEPVPPKEE
jgi:hypothetical protein